MVFSQKEGEGVIGGQGHEGKGKILQTREVLAHCSSLLLYSGPCQNGIAKEARHYYFPQFCGLSWAP